MKAWSVLVLVAKLLPLVFALSGESIFQLESSWIDQNGKKTTLGAFLGHPVVLAMVYTSCQGACPLITADVQHIESSLAPAMRERTRFVLVSFDPEHDSKTVLKNFGESHGLDFKRWTLLTGTPGNIRELAAVLGVKYKKDTRGNFSHSNIITVLDANGVLRYQQVGLRQDPQNSVRAILSAIKMSTGHGVLNR